MALNCVFSNELQFASSCEQTETDERDKEALADDLEEGEIEDDDEQPVEEKPVPEPSKDQNGSKDDTARPQTEATDNKVTAGEKQRDKRPTGNNSSGGNNNAGRSKRRAGSHEPTGRESQRKRRKTHDNDAFQHGEGMGGLSEGRGASPSRPYHRAGDSAGSDGEDNQVSTSPRRARNAHDRRSRTNRGSPARRRNNRGNSRDRNADRRRDRADRDRRAAKQSGPPASRIKDESICAFFMEGKCSRGNDCPYSHAALPPRKMELCKFYLMDCCAKKEKCLYLHKDFPCKFFHTGKKCRYTAESCKFSHETLSETMRAILIKHIETAPREILGDFPRLTREETIQAIDNFSNPLPQSEKRPGLPALFEQPNSKVNTQDINRDAKDSNVAMGGELNQNSPRSSNRPSFYEEVAIGHGTEESKDGKLNEENSRSIWFGKLRNDLSSDAASKSDTESAKPTDTLRSPRYDEDFRQPPITISDLPPRQRHLFWRIQQQQREPLAAMQDMPMDKDERAVNKTCHSSDDEEADKSLACLALKSIHGELPRRDAANSSLLNADLNPSQDMDAMNAGYQSLQKTSGQADLMGSMGPGDATAKRDPRTRDPRKQRSNEVAGDVDFRTFPPVSSRLDVDFRFENKLTMDCDFRNPYTTNRLASDDVKRPDVSGFRSMDAPYGSHAMMQRHVFEEIDASTSNNPPTRYHLYPIDIEPVDYGVIKVQADWAHLDPRQQKDWASKRNFSAIAESSNNTFYSPASPEPPAATSAPPMGRSYDASYSPGSAMQASHGDPRQRDPRSAGVAMENRGSAFPAIGSHHHPSEPDPFNPPYMHHQRSYPLPAEHSLDVPRDLHRPVENRRDPRQRFRNQT